MSEVTSISPPTLAEVKAAAKREIREERMKTASVKLKAKLLQIDSAETILANLNRELAELEHELAAGL